MPLSLAFVTRCLDIQERNPLAFPAAHRGVGQGKRYEPPARDGHQSPFPSAVQGRKAYDLSKARVALVRFHRSFAIAAFGAALSAVVSVALLGGSAAPALAAGCPNEAIRAEQGEAATSLPNCRAYEMVSPNGSSPSAIGDGRYNVAPSGERLTYGAWDPYPGSGNESLTYVSARGANGWTTTNPIPGQNGAKASSIFDCDPSFFVDQEIDHLLLVSGYRTPEPAAEEEGEECYGDEPPLDPGESRGTANIFRTDPVGSSYELLNRTPVGVPGKNALPLAATADQGVVVFTEPAKLTADAPEPTGGSEGENLYIWTGGTTRNLAYLPDGTPILARVANAGPGHNLADATHAISTDGERVYFEYESKIYLREHALREPSAVSGGLCTEAQKACTIPVDVSEEGPSEYGGNGTRARFARHFQYATPDGSRVFFTDCRKLTPDSTAAAPTKNEYGEYVNEKPDLYEMNVETGQTRDLTVDATEPANVRGVSGVSENGEYIYFAAYANLTGAEQNSSGNSAVAGRANLYLLNGGAFTYIATMEGGQSIPTGTESTDWQENGTSSPATESGRGLSDGNPTVSFTANGKYLMFPSTEPLTGISTTPAEPEDCYANFGTVTGISGPANCQELYLYEAESGNLACVSCNPSGEPPTGTTTIYGSVHSLWSYESPYYVPRAITETGTVFFSSPDGLLPQDTNGHQDVYEYEGGQLSLISTGKGAGSSELYGASANGSDVFFNTGQGLVGRDGDEANSLYDARVDGGFTEPPPLPGCEGEACRGAGTSKSAETAAGTSGFSGPGDKVEKAKRDCTTYLARAKQLSKTAKQLRRQASKASGGKAARLKRKADKYAKQGSKVSKQAKTCRRANQGGK
jgi:hypothetical protein